MQDIFIKYRKPIIITVLVAIVAWVGWTIYYSVFVFHVTSTTPDLSRVSNTAPYIKVTFNKPIDKSSVRLKSDNVGISSDVDSKTLTINLLELMTAGQAYTVSIDSIGSTSGDVLKDYPLTFTPSNDPSYLTADQEKAILDQQEANKSPVLDDPIFKVVPYSTLDYSLDGVINDDQSVTITITIQLSAADVSSGADAATARYKQEALDYITSQGIDLSKYTVTTDVIKPTN
jgi:hypothetical protein